MTNFVAAVTNKLLITAAYKSVAMAIMLTNCNLFVEQTRLPSLHPLAETDVILSRGNVNPPGLMGFGGSIVTEKYFFGFGNDHLANFWQWEFRPNSQMSIQAQHERWAKMPSLVGTNEVRQLALQWLGNLGVDVTTLEKKYPCQIKQKYFYKKTDGTLSEQSKAVVMLPIFQISWGAVPLAARPEYTLPAVILTVFGPTSELIEFHLYDDALMPRKLIVKGAEKLLAISDADFSNLDEMQRSNLVQEAISPSP